MNTVDLPWPPATLSPNSRVHWRVKHKDKKQHQSDCYFLARKANITPLNNAGIHVYIDFYPANKRKRDVDNLIASCKGLLDGVADAMLVDDCRFILHPNLKDEVVKFGLVKLTVSDK